MEIKIEDIKVNKRIRKTPGDLQPLMESMSRHGQLNSIVVNSRLQLVAGYRRLESAKKLGWKYINAVIIDKESKADLLEIEIEENIQRSNFTADEVSYAYRKLAKLRKKNIFSRILSKIVSFFKNIKNWR